LDAPRVRPVVNPVTLEQPLADVAVKATAPWYDYLIDSALEAIVTNTQPSDHVSSGSADAHLSQVTSPEAR